MNVEEIKKEIVNGCIDCIKKYNYNPMNYIETDEDLFIILQSMGVNNVNINRVELNQRIFNSIIKY